MRAQPTGGRVRAAAVALCSIAVIATAACAASAPGPAPVRQQPMVVRVAAAAATATASVPVVVDCAVHPRTRPGQYILACANGGAYLASLHWATWGSSAAFADGISTFNDASPTARQATATVSRYWLCSGAPRPWQATPASATSPA